MNDTTDVTPPGSPARLPVQGGGDSPSTAGGVPPQPGSRASERLLMWLAVLVLLLGIAAGAWFVQDRLGRLEREVARRDQTADVREQQFEQQIKLLGDTLREAQGKAAVLEARVAESLGQQSQLRALYDQMARNRGDLALADVESSVMIAAQQLQLAGNVQSALLALQDADQVLARSNQPAMLGLRRVLARDIERLRAVPVADFAAAVSRLDAVIDAVDSMPLMSDVEPSVPPRRAAVSAAGAASAPGTATPGGAGDAPVSAGAGEASAAVNGGSVGGASGAGDASGGKDASAPNGTVAAEGAAGAVAGAEADPSEARRMDEPAPRTGLFAWLPERVTRTGLQGWEAFVAELRQLVRVQRVDRPEVLLLSAEQRFLARESLRLQLLNARLNLLARNEPLLRADLGRASATIDRLFDPQSRTVMAAQASIASLQATPLALDLPSLAETIAAVRAARIPGESR